MHVPNLVPGMQPTAFVTILLISPKLICVYLYCSICVCICEYSYSSNTSFSILTSYACFPCHSVQSLDLFRGEANFIFLHFKKIVLHTIISPSIFPALNNVTIVTSLSGTQCYWLEETEEIGVLSF